MSEASIGGHTFGHDGRRYRTLASQGLDEDACRQLERFTWGQSGKDSILDSLGDDPALWIEPRDGFVAVTRVERGTIDAAGRPTLVFHTVTFDPTAWTESAPELIARCLLDQSGWPRLPRLLSTAVGTRGAARLPRATWEELVDYLGHSAGRSTTVVLPAGTVSAWDCVALYEALPEIERVRVSMAVGALSDAVRVSVLCPHAGAVQERAQHRRVPLPQALAHARKLRDTRAAASRATTGRLSRGPLTPLPSPQPEELTMNSRVLFAFLVLACLVVGLGLAQLVSGRRQADELRDTRQQIDELHDQIQRLEHAQDERLSQLEGEIARLRAELAGEESPGDPTRATSGDEK